MLAKTLAEQDIPDIVHVLCDSFTDYPFFQFVLGDEGASDYEQLKVLMHYYTMAGFLRDEPTLGVSIDSTLCAVALVRYRDGRADPPELGVIRDQAWKSFDQVAQERSHKYHLACDRFESGEPHVHLDMLGVLRTHQGRGLGRMLLDSVHQLSVEMHNSVGVSLTTETAENVKLYEYFGYRIVGHAQVSSELESWTLFRENDF